MPSRQRSKLASFCAPVRSQKRNGDEQRPKNASDSSISPVDASDSVADVHCRTIRSGLLQTGLHGIAHIHSDVLSHVFYSGRLVVRAVAPASGQTFTRHCIFDRSTDLCSELA